ncbi:hypothetical protein RUM43_012093 [Polyplax serrata]|uniref:Methionine--tRNA ligase, cytoplasmic n=1 Tax=Polyplax serrata TaxID=468196 RepID=A0AAN8P300_POLSC
MILSTNENNTNSLKVLIASELSGESVKVETAPLEKPLLNGSKALPQLILDSGVHLFCSNSAARYLLAPKTNEESILVNYFFDLESCLIQPLTILLVSKTSNHMKKKLEEILNQLNKEVSSKTYLCGKEISVGDVSIWCSLYPLFTDEKTYNDLFESRRALIKWFENVKNLPKVQAALNTYPVKEGLSSIFSSIPTKMNVASLTNDTTIGEKVMPPSTVENTDTAVTEDEKKAAAKSFNQKFSRLPKAQVKPVLPIPGEKNILITSALPYVNNVPHLGNIIGCVLSADVFARYCRLRGYNTLYISGTDEYGTATETKALEEKLSPKEICDKYFKIHDAIYKWFNIKFDYFGRTTTPQQTEICQEIFKKIYKNGFILVDSVEQLLCEKCDRYLADRFVEGTCPKCKFVDARGDQCDGCGHLINATELIKPRCKICQDMPVLRESKQFFLDLPKIQPLLKNWIEKSWLGWSHNAREISRAWLSDGLKPRCITRDLKWGIPVPLEGFQNKVFYVWFDAPIGYISITKLYTEHWREWWQPEPETNVNLYQFMAKDNVPFHSVMFPSSLLATKEAYLTVDNIFATEYLNYEDGKFSKSRGIGVFGNDAQDTGIPADVWRFYLLYVRPESQDSSFSWADLALKNNSELLSVLGNFINRALMFCEKNYDFKVPNISLTDDDHELIALVNRELTGYISVLEKGKLRDGIRHILSVARLGNQYMQSTQPWVLCKGTSEEKKRGESVIGLSINLSCLLAQLLDPYMPETSDMIRKQLNCPPELNVIDNKFRLFLTAGHKIGRPFPLFAKIESEQIEQLKAKYAGRQGILNPHPAGDSGVDVASLEAAVAVQGNVVRKMKEAGQSKADWGPQVTILLDLKKKLAEAQEKTGKSVPKSTAQTVSTSSSSLSVEEMEEKVKTQGDRVRKLKESGVDKSQWQPEVNVLLELKKQLSELKGEPLPPPSGKKNKK